MQRRWKSAAALLLVAALSAVQAAAPAFAVPPPRVNSSALVPTAPVGPTEPTEQRTFCATATLTVPVQTPSPAQSLMNLEQAWRFGRGRGQVVAVIDTGVTPHPRLGRVRAGGDYVGDGGSGGGLRDCDAHGTLVAGIIAGRPAPGDAFVGVAPEASIISIRQSSSAYEIKDRRRAEEAAGDANIGAGYGSVRTLAHAVVRAVDMGATVINISEVACGAAGSNLNDAALGAAVKYAFDRDVVVVVAAGNLTRDSACQEQNPTPDPADVDGWDSVTTVASPAWFTPYVLAVGSVDGTDGAPSGFSLHGPWVSVAAPGTDIVSLDSAPGSPKLVSAVESQDGPVTLRGTSFATPYVAGTVALVRARYPQLSAAQIMERIVRTAHAPGTGRDDAIGFGVIDPVAALTAHIPPGEVRDFTSTPFTPPPEPPAPDTRARDVALWGSAITLAAVGALVALAYPFRRLRRLGPDEF